MSTDTKGVVTKKAIYDVLKVLYNASEPLCVREIALYTKAKNRDVIYPRVEELRDSAPLAPYFHIDKTGPVFRYTLNPQGKDLISLYNLYFDDLDRKSRYEKKNRRAKTEAPAPSVEERVMQRKRYPTWAERKEIMFKNEISKIVDAIGSTVKGNGSNDLKDIKAMLTSVLSGKVRFLGNFIVGEDVQGHIDISFERINK